MTFVADLEDFVMEHRPHGTLKATTGGLTPNGYGLEVAWPCGVTLERWITPQEAAGDLVIVARLNGPIADGSTFHELLGPVGLVLAAPSVRP